MFFNSKISLSNYWTYDHSFVWRWVVRSFLKIVMVQVMNWFMVMAMVFGLWLFQLIIIKKNKEKRFPFLLQANIRGNTVRRIPNLHSTLQLPFTLTISLSLSQRFLLSLIHSYLIPSIFSCIINLIAIVDMWKRKEHLDFESLNI